MRKHQLGQVGVFALPSFGNKVAHPHRVDVGVQRFAYIGIEQPRKIVFVISKNRRNAVKRYRFAVVPVYIVQRRNYYGDIWGGSGGHALVVVEKAAHYYIYIPLFYERGCVLLFVQRKEVRKKRAVELPVGKVGGQRPVLEYA